MKSEGEPDTAETSVWTQFVDPGVTKDISDKALQLAGFSLASLVLVADLFKDKLVTDPTVRVWIVMMLCGVILFLVAAEIARNAVVIRDYLVAESAYIVAMVLVIYSFVSGFSGAVELGLLGVLLNLLFVAFVATYVVLGVKGIWAVAKK